MLYYIYVYIYPSHRSGSASDGPTGNKEVEKEVELR